MNYSWILKLSCLFFLLNCSMPPNSQPDFSLQAAAYKAKYRTSTDSHASTYLQYLLKRLNVSSYSVSIIDSPELIALSVSTTDVLISKSLILKLENEAQLAFVLAHEFAHKILDHHQQNQDDRALFELQADQIGLKIILQAGYNPWEAIRVTQKLAYEFKVLDKNASTSYPSITQRISELGKTITQSNWTAPGTIDRRDFKIFVSSLR